MLLTIVFSNHCDLDCTYCCIGDKNTSPILSLSAAIEFIDKFSEEENILEFYGGEPTLHREDILEVIKYCESLSNSYTYRIYTNGLFKDYTNMQIEEFVDKIDEFLISLDGYTYEDNLPRFESEDEFNAVMSNINHIVKYINDNNLDTSIGISSVLYGIKKYKNIYDSYLYFSNIGIRYFSYEPISVYNDDKPMVIPKSHMYTFIKEIYKVIDDIYSKDEEYELFVAKEFLSSKWYNFDASKSCSSIARAISPRAKVYMCRDYAANEEKMFHSPKIISFKSTNKLEIDYDNFKSISDMENKLTPCIVKNNQYLSKLKEEDLYWLSDDFQSLIIRPLLKSITYINADIKDSSRELFKKYYNNLENILSFLKCEQ